jgi:predicted GNAT superfamily acetyltransferase
MSVRVRPITAEDFDEILSINSESVPHVADLDDEELRRLVTLASVVWVAESAMRVVGYLVGMSDSDGYDGEEFGWFLKRFDQPFMYVDQIAVDARARRANVASQMYGHLAHWCITLNINLLCCEVNMRPANSISVSFHEKFGFKRLDELETSDGRRVALLYKHTLWPNQTMEPTR